MSQQTVHMLPLNTINTQHDVDYVGKKNFELFFQKSEVSKKRKTVKKINKIISAKYTSASLKVLSGKQS